MLKQNHYPKMQKKLNRVQILLASKPDPSSGSLASCWHVDRDDPTTAPSKDGK